MVKYSLYTTHGHLTTSNNHQMSHVRRKPDFCLCKNKGADQLCSNGTTDQRLCFRHTDSTIPLLSKFKIFSLQPSSVHVQLGLCRTWSKKSHGFLMKRLKSSLTVCTVNWFLSCKFACTKIMIAINVAFRLKHELCHEISCLLDVLVG